MGDKKKTGPSTSQSLGPVSTRGEPCVRMLPQNAPHFPDSTTIGETRSAKASTLLDGSKHQGQGETTAAHPFHAVTYWDTVGMGRGAKGR